MLESCLISDNCENNFDKTYCFVCFNCSWQSRVACLNLASIQTLKLRNLNKSLPLGLLYQAQGKQDDEQDIFGPYLLL